MTKKQTKPKKSKLPERIKLFVIRYHYLTYLQEESYKYYMDFQDSMMDEGSGSDSQIVFSSHFFNNHVDKTRIHSRVVEVFQDNLNSILDEISSTIFKLSMHAKMDPFIVAREFLSTQTQIEEHDGHKISGLYSFIEKRIGHIIELNNKIAASLKKGELTEEDVAAIIMGSK